MTPPQKISKYFVFLERVITRWMKLTTMLTNISLIDVVVLPDSSMMTAAAAAAAILVLIRPSRVKS